MSNTTLHTHPRHVAVIMDGNGRWAKKRLLPRAKGHQSAVARVRELIESAAQKGVDVLTLFAFSSENWRRPKTEIDLLMRLLVESLNREIKKLHEAKVVFKVIGNLSKLSATIQKSLLKAEQLTQDNTGLTLVLAINYGGQWDILNATRTLAKKVASQQLAVEQIDAQLFESMLTTESLPPVDLLIRTSGEQRISNFLLWQCAYSELYFTETLFPDFDRQAFEKALQWYQSRERRFGKTSEQIKET